MAPNERNVYDAAREEQIEQQLAELIRERERLRAARNTDDAEEDDKGRHPSFSSSSSEDDIPHVRGRRSHRKSGEVDWNLKLKGDIPKFSGTETPAEVVDWLILINEIFEQMEVPENKRVGIIVMQLQGKAMAWWHYEKQIAPITEWQLMEEKLRSHFLPSNYRRELYQQYQQLSQGTRTVDEYTNELKELVIRLNVRDSKEMLLSKYLFGLQPYIKDALEELEIEDLGQAHLRALKVEKAQKRKEESIATLTESTRHIIGFSSSNPTAPLTVKLGQEKISEETRKAALACYEAAPDEVKRSAETLFKFMDVDGDGKICVKEFAEFLRENSFCNNPDLLLSEFGWVRKEFLEFWEVIVFFYVNDTRNVWSDVVLHQLRLSDLKAQPRQPQVGLENMQLAVYHEPRNKMLQKAQKMALRGGGKREAFYKLLAMFANLSSIGSLIATLAGKS